MSPRLRRLIADFNHMNELVCQAPVDMRYEGSPPETYQLMISVPGLARGQDGQLMVRRVHRCSVYLHADYPLRPPVVTWLTPIVHPNILPPERNGGVCIGMWSPSQSLADVVRQLVDLVSYRSFNPADALDKQAAAWVIEQGVQPGQDLADLVRNLCSAETEPFDVVVRRS